MYRCVVRIFGVSIAAALGIVLLLDSELVWAIDCFQSRNAEKPQCRDKESNERSSFNLFGSDSDEDSETDAASDPSTDSDRQYDGEQENVSADDVDFISYPPSVGPKRTIAVLTFENKAKGVVSEFQYQSEGGGLALAFSNIDFALNSKSAHVGLDIRLIDPNTAEIIDSHAVSAKASATGFDIGYAKSSEDLRIGTGYFEKTPFGQAARLAIQRAVLTIVRKSEAVVWSGKIIKADNTSAYVNRGLNSNLGVGDKLTVFSKGEDLIDPETGLLLGADEEPIGTLKLTTVKEKSAIGTYSLLSGQAVIKRG